MTQIFIDGQLVIPASNASIKFTAENSYFTKSSSYTYEVELPLSIPQNRAVYGNLNRIDVAKRKNSKPATLIVDNVTILVGEANVTHVDESAVKVQLLGAAAAYNYGTKADELYIDELDLGDYYRAAFPDGSYFEGTTKKYYPEDYMPSNIETIERIAAMGDYEDDEQLNIEGERTDLWERDRISIDRLLSWRGLPFTAYPTVNTSADNAVLNEIRAQETAYGSQAFRHRWGAYGSDYANKISIAFQPFVWFIAERIAKATGFTLERDDNALYDDNAPNSLFNRIFIASTSTSMKIARSLPHWTVNEWWTQLEDAFGLVFWVDYVSRKIKLTRRATHYDHIAPNEVINDVVDEFDVDVDSGEDNDIAIDSVGFEDFDYDPGDRLSTEVRDAAVVNNQFSNLAEIKAWIDAGNTASFDTIYECADGRRFIRVASYNGYQGIMEVDMLRDRLVGDDTDASIKIKFVPAAFDSFAMQVLRGRDGSSAIDAHVGAKCLTVEGVGNVRDTSEDELNIEYALKGEQEVPGAETETKPEKIYMAIWYPTSNVYELKFSDIATPVEVSCRCPSINERSILKPAPNNYVYNYFSPYGLALVPISGQKNLYSETVEGSIAVRTDSCLCVKFVANNIPDVSAIFNIRNRQFVCRKVEVSISARGLDKLITGYFYELENYL